MSKKRTLSDISADMPSLKEDSKNVLPAVSMFTDDPSKMSSMGKTLRGVEYLVNPDDCKPWKYHNRDEVWMNADKCKALISSIRKNGQKFPVIARKLENDPEGKKWEIIAGRRRWFACKHIGEQLKLKSTDANDRDCAILMNLENKDREDVSEFEDAISYRQQLEAALFDSQDDMAIALDLNKSKLSKMLGAAKIINHNEVMRLFDDFTTLKINPVYKLVVEIEKSNDNKSVIYKKAENLFYKINKEKLKMSTTLIITKLLESLDASSKTSLAPKYFKINGNVIVKATKSNNGYINFEIKEKDCINLKKEQLKEVFLQALEECL